MKKIRVVAEANTSDLINFGDDNGFVSTVISASINGYMLTPRECEDLLDDNATED